MAGRILIVDGVATNRIILKAKLSAARYEVLQAETAQQMLGMARQNRPDLIILDTSLPDQNAVRVCRALKRDPKTKEIPVVVMTAADEAELRITALQAGADEVQAKPLAEPMLLALVRNLIRSRAAYDELSRRQTPVEELGFADDAPRFERRARIAMIMPAREAGFAWRLGLAERLTGRIEVLTRTGALEHLDAGEAPDAYVIAANLGEEGDGLRLLSELRSRSATRLAVIVMHLSQDNPAQAAMALDLGVDAVLTGPVDVGELAARLKTLIRRKFETDALRQSLDQRLSLAMKDPLTGLYNRRYAEHFLARALQEARNDDAPLTLMLLDLDRFKSINDRFGHQTGDDVLIEVGNRLRRNLREIDLLARIGGEEFLIALPRTSLERAGRVSERLRAVIGDDPVRLSSGRQVPVTLSIGVVVDQTGPGALPSLEALIQEADRALYSSKAEGRNLVTFVPSAA